MPVLQKTIRLHRVQSQFRRSDALFRAFVGGRGAGKALCIETPLATPYGWTTMGEVQVGDSVFDERGVVCRVIGATDVMIGRPCYEVRFSDGSTLIADAEHEWAVTDRRARKSLRRRKGGPNVRGLPQCKPKHLPRIVTTLEMASAVYDGREVNFAVQVADPIQLPAVDLPVPPYTLGAWLGDGTSSSSDITSMDEEIVEAIRAEGFSVAAIPSQMKGRAWSYSIRVPNVGQKRNKATGRLETDERCLVAILRTMGVLGNKHIPVAYLRASESQRRDLLAGLMDTDGYVSDRGMCEFTSTSARIADGVLELCLSLGLKAKQAEGIATLNGRIIGPKYRVTFTSYEPVCRLLRKRNRQSVRGSQADRQGRRYVVAVEPVSSVPVRCIEVDSLNHLYLAGRSMIPTHNSWCGAYDLLRRVKAGRCYLVGSPTGILMGDTTYPTFKSLAEELGVWQSVKLTPYPTATIRTQKGTCEVRFRTAEDPERMRGPNLSGVWLDEASIMPEDAYKINIAALREGGAQGWLSATFTPKGPTHWTYQTFATDKPDTAMFRARTGENPFLPKDFEATLQGQYGETQFARQELGGEFVQIAGAEFPAEWFDWPGFWFDEWPAETVHKVLYLDPSKGVRDFAGDAKTGKQPDWQAYVLAALVREKHGDQLRNAIYLDAHLNREPVPEMIARGLRLAKEFGPQAIVFEDNGTMGFMGYEVQRQQSQADVLIPWHSITHKVPKIQRMRVLGGYLSQHQIRIRRTPGGKLMRAQMGDIPFSEYDDAVDAAAGAIEALGMLMRAT